MPVFHLTKQSAPKLHFAANTKNTVIALNGIPEELTVEAEENATVRMFLFGEDFSRHTVRVNLRKNGACVTLRAFALCRKDTPTRLLVTGTASAEGNTVDIRTAAVLEDFAQAHIDSTVTVEKTARDTVAEARQENIPL